MKDQRHNIWIVVADGGQARILLSQHRNEGVTELPLASKHDPRLAHHGENAANIHHTPVFKPNQERRDENAFLNRLAETLQTGVDKKECDQLVLVLPSAALGFLRNALSEATRKHVVAEIVHDYTNQTNDFVLQHVRDKLPL